MPFTGAPPTRRIKTYSAESGYVYQYLFSGFRMTTGAAGACWEYAFEFSTGRRANAQVSVILREQVLNEWSAAHRRALNASERFGIAKLALKNAFDAWSAPESSPPQVCPTLEDVETISSTLDL